MVFLTGARTRVGGPCRCSTLRWCLKKETSLIVVSMRSTQPYLSYILIEELAKRCLRPCCTDRSLGGEDRTVYQGPVSDHPGPPPCHSKRTKIAAITSRS